MEINKYLPDFSFNKKNIRYTLIVFFLYLLFLVTNIPATVALSAVNLPKNLSLASVSGTVWSGKAQQFRYMGISFGAVSWRLHPLNLILGELSADISVVNNEQYINTEAHVSFSGKIELEETRFSIDLSLLQPLIYGMPFAYSGHASGYFPVSYFQKNNYVGVNGKLSLSDITMISPQRQLLGGFTINLRAEKEGATSAKIKDNGGPLNIDGQLLLKKDGQLNISANLATTEPGSSLEQALSLFGRQDSSGRVQFNSNFKLWR